MGYVDVIQDKDFKFLVAELRIGFWQHIKGKKRFIETSWGKLYTLLHTGRLDAVGEADAIRMLNNPSASPGQTKKIYENEVVEHFPIIAEIAFRHNSRIYVVSSLLTAMASCEPEIKEILTLKEVEREWKGTKGTSESNLRNKFRTGAFNHLLENGLAKQSEGGGWFVHRQAMISEFGEAKDGKET